MTRQLIILAGGAGTRLRARLGDLPKPMIPIGGKPLLEHQVELAKKYGFTDLIFFVHYRADLIEKYFGDGKKFGVQIRYILEKEPLGTAGAVLAGFEELADRFVVLYVEFSEKTSEKRTKVSEAGVYTVKDGKIVREEFLTLTEN